ncbi:MAG: response regulator [Myxococcales bacterium]
MNTDHGYILVVDDDPDIRETMLFVLEDAGYEVVTAANGAEALECLRKNAARLILLDLMMPVMDGWQFRAAQRNDPLIGEIPVVVLTGMGRAAREATALKATACLEKPVDLEVLLSVAQQYCGASRADPCGKSHWER